MTGLEVARLGNQLREAGTMTRIGLMTSSSIVAFLEEECTGSDGHGSSETSLGFMADPVGNWHRHLPMEEKENTKSKPKNTPGEKKKANFFPPAPPCL